MPGVAGGSGAHFDTTHARVCVLLSELAVALVYGLAQRVLLPTNGTNTWGKPWPWIREIRGHFKVSSGLQTLRAWLLIPRGFLPSCQLFPILNCMDTTRRQPVAGSVELPSGCAVTFLAWDSVGKPFVIGVSSGVCTKAGSTGNVFAVDPMWASRRHNDQSCWSC